MPDAERTAGSLHRDCCAASADEWAKIGQDAAREAIKATLSGSGGWAQRLQDIAKHASQTEIAIRQTMQHNEKLTDRSPDENAHE